MTQPALTYVALSDLAEGTRVVTTVDFTLIGTGSFRLSVPAGTVGTITRNSLNEMMCVLFVRPDDATLRTHLADTDGVMHFGAHLNPMDDAENGDSTWHEVSPLAVATADDDLRVRLSGDDPQMLLSGDQTIEVSLATFLRDNADGIDTEEADEIRRTLIRKGTYYGGGGAAPEWELEWINKSVPPSDVALLGSWHASISTLNNVQRGIEQLDKLHAELEILTPLRGRVEKNPQHEEFWDDLYQRVGTILATLKGEN